MVLLPDVHDQDHAPFWQSTSRGRVSVQACRTCQERFLPPRQVCPSCGGMDIKWVEQSGRGAVYSWTFTPRPHASYQEFAPLTLVIVALELDREQERQVRLVGRLVPDKQGGDEPPPVAIGLPVVAEFRTVDDAVTLVEWRADPNCAQAQST